MSKIIVVGSINMDIVVFVDEFPKIGETIFGKDLEYFPGGKGSNQAIACRRLGCDALMVGSVGIDNFGEKMLKIQKKEGIDTAGISKVKNIATGTAFITVSKNSNNSIIVMPGANLYWNKNFLDNINISKNDLVLAQFEIPNWVIKRSFQKAKNCGAKTILNPSPVKTCSKEIINLTDIVVVNEIELQKISGVKINKKNAESIFTGAKGILKKGVKVVIVTLGDKGVYLFSKNIKKHLSARKVLSIDTTGAGDCFIGGLAAGLFKGYNLNKAIKFGNIVASISVTRKGAASSFPLLKEVEKYL